MLVTLLLVVILLYSEYVAHDCIPHKVCNHSVPQPAEEDTNSVFIDKTIDMVNNNTDYVVWRRALLAAVIGAVPIVYYILRRLPNLYEWVGVVLLVFLVTYLSSSWIWAHFFSPNADRIEEALLELKTRLV